ncbi:Acyl-CoA hydrolase [Rubritalea squalenifaciens DSM 18772]|uniref:Acyl-CoA hydrolase n=1 Tax=Rubritalea squalenifaciens DSM 18772 TaxID=1123071 RepID=A0A1M6GW00_9BACT|nr:acyl-CoA thioesterase [Rubritalea squalenifaciens]SHJ14119.1 Acyl-CoA hydrolase [Rubritalea squalenifaciens DSM 18772]
METHRLVFTEDLNPYGFLFGGRLLSWADEASYIAANQDYPKCRFVTIGMDKVEFRHSVKNGAILTIVSEQVRKGTTSITYSVTIYSSHESPDMPIFTTNVTFVNVDESGNKRPL